MIPKPTLFTILIASVALHSVIKAILHFQVYTEYHRFPVFSFLDCKALILSSYGIVVTVITFKSERINRAKGSRFGQPFSFAVWKITLTLKYVRILPGVTVSWKQCSLFGSGKCTLHVPAKETAHQEGLRASSSPYEADLETHTWSRRRSL